MSNLIVYQEEKSHLSELAFLKDVPSQVKVREIDSYEFSKQLALLLIKINALMGIKNEISNIYKTDIKKMILSRFKNLSLNEIYFAFKLERYGEYVDEKGIESRIDHYHDFNTTYVAIILAKYVKWKQNTKIKYNISAPIEIKEPTEEEKTYWINKAVTECIEYFEEHGSLMDGKLHVYGILYDLGYLPTSLEYKMYIKKQAIEVIQFEQNLRKPTTLVEKKEIKNILEEITKPKSGKVIIKCKELVLLEFFRKLYRDQEKVDELKEKFK